MRFTTSFVWVSSIHLIGYLALWWHGGSDKKLLQADGPQPRPTLVTRVKPAVAPKPQPTTPPPVAHSPENIAIAPQTRAVPSSSRQAFLSDNPNVNVVHQSTVIAQTTSAAVEQRPNLVAKTEPGAISHHDARAEESRVLNGQRGTLELGEVQMFVLIEGPTDALGFKQALHRHGHELVALAERNGTVYRAMLPEQGHLRLCEDQPAVDQFLRSRPSFERRWIALDAQANSETGYAKLFRDAFDRHRDLNADVIWRTYLVLAPQLSRDMDRAVLQACRLATPPIEDLGQAWITLRIDDVGCRMQVDELVRKLPNISGATISTGSSE